MKIALILGMLALSVAIIVLFIWRKMDHQADRNEMRRLIGLQPTDPPVFNIDLVADLPEPARRYFGFTIAEGTPLYTVAKIEMRGKFSIGRKEAPNYMDMTARQVLAAPHGFVWTLLAGSRPMVLSGSDSGSWTRFWLAGLAPVARFGGDPDHRRSAFGRYIAEAAFWTPAALLPGQNVMWELVDEETARFTVSYQGLKQAVDVTVDAEGRPVKVAFQRWSNANPDAVHTLQPFGGYLSEFREFQGFTVPTHVEAGNWFGTDDYFPFFIADVTSFGFPTSGSN